MLLPTVLVRGLSTIEESGFPLKSLDTSSLFSRPRMPFIGPSAAALRASLIDSLVTGVFDVKVRSTTETLGVGTRMAKPSSLPLSSGTTRCRALGAPVDVGIIERAARSEERRVGK